MFALRVNKEIRWKDTRKTIVWMQIGEKIFRAKIFREATDEAVAEFVDKTENLFD